MRTPFPEPLALLFLWLSLTSGCQPGKKADQPESYPDSGTVKQLIPNQYARFFEAYNLGSYTDLIISLDADQQKKIRIRLATTPHNETSADSIIHIQVPVRQIVSTSTTHLPALESLGEASALIGFAGKKYISSEIFRNKTEEELRDVGSAEVINLEALVAVAPEVVFTYVYEGAYDQYNRMISTGIPIIPVPEFLEKSPLARAEWIRFFGYFFQKESMADSLFNQIDTRYQVLKSNVPEKTTPRTVFSGIMYGDTWFAPGGNSWVAQFFADAGADYVLSLDETAGSNRLSYERVLQQAVTADLWIGLGAVRSLAELEQLDSRYRAFAAFNQGMVYNYTLRQIPAGGNLYFEEGYLRPDRILEDLIAIVHPSHLPDHSFHYFEQLD